MTFDPPTVSQLIERGQLAIIGGEDRTCAACGLEQHVEVYSHLPTGATTWECDNPYCGHLYSEHEDAPADVEEDRYEPFD